MKKKILYVLTAVLCMTMAGCAEKKNDESMEQEPVVETIEEAPEKNAEKAETMSEEEMIALLNERMPYLTESAYYDEMVQYWENVRGVRDISYHMEFLYQTDREYLTREELANEAPTVIHLAKNEIYARHGYIFRDKDLYNYFMGSIWYMPAIAPEDFRDEVFNEYEKANLELLAELDTL